jgi:hypothetical protein
MYGLDPPITHDRPAEPQFVDAFEAAPVIGLGIAVETESAWAMGTSVAWVRAGQECQLLLGSPFSDNGKYGCRQ